MPPAHYGYTATGVDKIDMSTTLLGTAIPTPILVMPTGSQRAFHPDDELATARAAKARDHLMLLSTADRPPAHGRADRPPPPAAAGLLRSPH